jgi:hypothetical protein
MESELSALTSVLPSTYDDVTHVQGEQMMYDGDPKIWGATWWRMMHLTAYYYPEAPTQETQQAAYQQFDAWRFTLPCGNCRDGYRVIWNQIPLRNYLATRTLLIEWSILVHDAVNARLGAPVLDFRKYMNALVGDDAVIMSDDEEDDTAAKSDATATSALDDVNANEKASADVEKESVDLENDALSSKKNLVTSNQAEQQSVAASSSSLANKPSPASESKSTAAHTVQSKEHQRKSKHTKSESRSSHQEVGMPKKSAPYNPLQRHNGAIQRANQQQQQANNNGRNRVGGPSAALSAMATMAAKARTRQEQQFAAMQQQRLARYGIGGQQRLSVPPPRECSNCSRKSGPLTPSVF